MNIYYSPERFGLTLVVSVELTEPSYSFDKFVVWKNSQGVLFWGADAGCSCPSPFEDQGVADLSQGTKAELLDDLELKVTSRLKDIGGTEWYDERYNEQNRFALAAKATVVEAVQ